MDKQEFAHFVSAVLILFVVVGLGFVLDGNPLKVSQAFVFAFLIILVHVFAKKGVAYMLDASVRHRVWHVYRYGVGNKQHFKKEVPFGLLVPLLFTLFSLGAFKIMTLLSYETSALKQRAAKRFGYYSYTEMTDWHNGLIGAAGIAAVLLVFVVGYFSGVEYLAKIAAYYAFWNMIPFSELDGTQILFGNRILWAVLGFLSLIFVLISLFVL